MTASRELEGEKAGAAAGVERVERASAGQNKLEDAVPGRALRWSADAVAEVLIEVRRPSIPMGRDLSPDEVGLAACLARAHLPASQIDEPVGKRRREIVAPATVVQVAYEGIRKIRLEPVTHFDPESLAAHVVEEQDRRDGDPGGLRAR